ncbi:MAG: hypothetical protein JOZ52_05870 [Acidobacteria bacterium]|nr:hypothetical protein [Acidobacteriota bacterium]
MSFHLFRITLVLLFMLTTCALVEAQGDNRQAPNASTPSAETRTSADETFELNITERHITETGFEASTSVEAGEESARGLRLRIGVGIGADVIDVKLLGVRGRVRFRATLAPVLERINSRRPQSPSPSNNFSSP